MQDATQHGQKVDLILHRKDMQQVLTIGIWEIRDVPTTIGWVLQLLSIVNRFLFGGVPVFLNAL